MLLEVEGLTTTFPVGGRWAPAVRDVSFNLSAGETLALVGESGSGKSLTALSCLRLVPAPGRVAGGAVRWQGRDLLQATETDLHRVRGGEIGLALQDPASALNPTFTVGDQLRETVLTHTDTSAEAAADRALALLGRAGIPDPAGCAEAYPHQLSGGLRQRVVIALALAGSPTLLVADEPTTGLDATTQARVVELLDTLVRTEGLALLLITHDLRVVRQSADRIAVMYAGEIIEEGPATDVLGRPDHPYTRGLLAAVPRDGTVAPVGIDGAAPRLGMYPPGCGFAPRCSERLARCDDEAPARWGEPGRGVRCHLFDPKA